MQQGAGEKIRRDGDNFIGYRVAELSLWLDGKASAIRMVAPPGHTQFLMPEKNLRDKDLTLQVYRDVQVSSQVQRELLCGSETWNLWLDVEGNYVFDTLMHSPASRITLKPDFSSGEIIGEFPPDTPAGVFPLLYLDIIIFSNWLANVKDVILHAAGAAIDGRGYCFVGASGAGKSTLAAALHQDHSVTVLGEDQVVLRYLNNQYWIFGTPWHVNPDLCSPVGVPLEKLFLLEKTGAYRVSPVSPLDGITRLLQTAFIPYYRSREVVSGIIENVSRLPMLVPFYRLEYPLGSEVMKLITQA